MSAQRQTSDTAPSSNGALVRALGGIEKVGNKLPHPFWLFLIIAAVILVVSAVLGGLGVSAQNPADDKTVAVKNLLNTHGLHKIIEDAVPNFVDFPPLGLIIAVMLGVAVAENTGLIPTVVHSVVTKVPAKWLTFVLALTGVTGSVASDAIYVVLIPLGAVVFRAAGRSAILGAVVAFGSASAGYDASLIVNGTDPLLAGLSTSAAKLIDPHHVVSPLSNYFFTAVSSLVLAAIVTLVTETLLVRTTKRLQEDRPAEEESDAGETDVSRAAQARGMRNAGTVLVVLVIVFAAALAIPQSPLRGKDGGVLTSPLLSSTGISIVIGVFFLVVGIAYGVTAGTITKARDVPAYMGEGVKQLGPVLVLFFAAAQFVAYFKWSNLGPILAIKGAELIEKMHVPNLVLFGLVVLFVTVLNLFITSGSAEWALVAPILVPMLMLLGVQPEVTQMLYRMGDSPTNVISPMSPYFALALGFIQRYKSSAGIGTLLSLTLPVSISILVGWFLFFVIWYLIGIPLGPGAPIR